MLPVTKIAEAANYQAIGAAALAGFLVGLVWYAIFGRLWSRALGGTHRSPSVWLFVTAFVGSLVMAAMLQGVITHTGLWGAKDGIISACFLWIGFVLTSLGVSESFQKRPACVIAIDTGHWLAELIIMGAIIGAMGPP